ncbi:PIG-L deacetylase family protein [Sporosarcina sp. 179-K 3D1 HS]|uniref:PIG-L deacetylase family protein n=1 Tax=Sporosarcina sp. 179-K 3D1 HS TaxID=3232169 RepID=UPI0039A25567
MITSGTERILIIAPHADDEILGCGGLIEKACRFNNHVKVIVVAVGDITHPHKGAVVTGHTRKKELQEALAYLGCTDFDVLYDDKDSLLDTVPKSEIIQKLDTILDGFRPTMVFIPLPSYHQDHIVLFEASFAALRPKPNQFIKLIAMYEYPLITWQYQKFWNTGELYLDITDTMQKKLNSFLKHKSQIRPKEHLISPENVVKWAEMRGMEVGMKYAEKFYILRSHM